MSQAKQSISYIPNIPLKLITQIIGIFSTLTHSTLHTHTTHSTPSHTEHTHTHTPHPLRVPLKLTWAGRSKEISAHWFQYESDPTRNSNVYEVAQKALNDNFPGEFGSERLAQEVVDRILAVTATQENLEQVTGLHPPTVEKVQSPTTPTKHEPAGNSK